MRISIEFSKFLFNLPMKNSFFSQNFEKEKFDESIQENDEAP